MRLTRSQSLLYNEDVFQQHGQHDVVVPPILAGTNGAAEMCDRLGGYRD